MDILIITNNPKVNAEYSGKYMVEYHEDMDQLAVLRKARDYIHLGAKLIAHPMMGRIKPHETPYKSVIMEKLTGNLDFLSLQIIEDSIKETTKFLTNTYMQKYDDLLLPDLAFIDSLLMASALEECTR